MIIGITGGIGIGKSFVASCFEKLGAAVFDADSVVHQLYKVDKGIISHAEKNFPGVVIDGEINRAVLSKYFLAYDKNWIKFQSLVHSAVLCKLELFIECEKKINRKFLVLDLPLLLETNIHLYCDLIIFVHANSAVQNQRLSERNIGKEKLNLISKIQLPIEVKRKASDFIINTDVSEEEVFSQVKKIVDSLT
ncbi:dephospho-CoA kinase [Wolbachia endosymbiont of Folsomia candida]|uniref:dephospho-CoA kinase n=1 Tax=Wolbachia endosymbiont of Folsomia candida TaxID=169402 RepID=UPI000B613DA2|nr:dephospho-CoA kinase [Wolbachia endosymbiont of Folsomia candida]APR99162.1 dephospho-CoA kinase [Wolbachia endosymbiont of Folsomia candida]